jgi:alkylation response protein AidB-like acyl-CoA dehydrogenase
VDVLLNEEEQMIKGAVREFLEAESPTSLVRAMEKDPLGYPPELWQKMAQLDWFGMCLPEAYGGQELPLTYLGILLHEIGRHITPVPLHSTQVPALMIAKYGTEEQKSSILPRVCNGELIMTFAFQEMDARLLPEAVQMEAKADGDSYVLNGTKTFVDNFNVAEKVLVAARTASGSDPRDGISVFIVDTNSQGVSHTPYVTTAKDKQSKVQFSNVRVPAANLVGEAGKGWTVARDMMDHATALISAQLCGAARKDAELAIEYSKGRIAFGRPIGSFQSLQHLMADMTIWVDGAQLLTEEAIWRLGEGLPASVEVSQAKAFANEKCLAACRSSQQIHGGIGFMMEFDLHLWYRRVAAWGMRYGSSFEHRARVATALLDQPGRFRLGQTLEPVGY